MMTVSYERIESDISLFKKVKCLLCINSQQNLDSPTILTSFYKNEGYRLPSMGPELSVAIQ